MKLYHQVYSTTSKLSFIQYIRLGLERGTFQAEIFDWIIIGLQLFRMVIMGHNGNNNRQNVGCSLDNYGGLIIATNNFQLGFSWILSIKKYLTFSLLND